jgi:hypothetical protein
MISLINTETLAELTQGAKASPRLRKNFNFHASNESSCHRLLNALEGPYVALAAAEKASWAPAEGEAGCAAYLAQMAAVFSAG